MQASPVIEDEHPLQTRCPGPACTKGLSVSGSRHESEVSDGGTVDPYGEAVLIAKEKHDVDRLFEEFIEEDISSQPKENELRSHLLALRDKQVMKSGDSSFYYNRDAISGEVPEIGTGRHSLPVISAAFSHSPLQAGSFRGSMRLSFFDCPSRFTGDLQNASGWLRQDFFRTRSCRLWRSVLKVHRV